MRWMEKKRTMTSSRRRPSNTEHSGGTRNTSCASVRTPAKLAPTPAAGRGPGDEHQEGWSVGTGHRAYPRAPRRKAGPAPLQQESAVYPIFVRGLRTDHPGLRVEKTCLTRPSDPRPMTPASPMQILLPRRAISARPALKVTRKTFLHPLLMPNQYNKETLGPRLLRFTNLIYAQTR